MRNKQTKKNSKTHNEEISPKGQANSNYWKINPIKPKCWINIDVYPFILLLRIIFFKKNHEPVLIKTALIV